MKLGCAGILVQCGIVALALGTVVVAGCKPSPYVRTTITNVSGDSLQQLELDYPSASFGRNKLPPGDTYSYRFKIIGEGKPHLQFQDSSGKQHQADGPDLKDGEKGTLEIRIAPAYSVAWAWTPE
jgi:hypothetical protein